MKLTFAQLHAWLFLPFRRRRLERFHARFQPQPGTQVLDVGGTEQTWTTESPSDCAFPVTLLNILDYGVPRSPRFRAVRGDGRRLPFADQAFPIVFSNSVIEHVGALPMQQAFAAELRRVGQGLWVQTPARCFPIEAHLWAPFIHYLPRSLQRRLARYTPRAWMQPEVVDQIVDEVRLLTHAEMRHLFPDCQILSERFLFLTKSYIAVRDRTPIAPAPGATTAH